MSDEKRPMPSLEQDWPLPHGWVQWKGTKVCMDVHCRCGYLGHVDAEFCYYLKCPECGQVYEVGGHVKLYPVDVEPDDTVDAA